MNAHLHQRNHPDSIEDLDYCISTSSNKFSSMYLGDPIMSKVAKKYSIDINQYQQPEIWRELQTAKHSEYKNCVQHCLDQDIPVVYVHPSPSTQGYFWNSRSLGKDIVNNKPFHNEQEKQNVIDAITFSNIDNQLPIWDQREIMALNVRPLDTSMFPTSGWEKPYLRLESNRLWHNTQSTMLEILDFFKLTVDTRRLNHWKLISKEWQQIQLDSLKFWWKVDSIVESIVNGWFYQLPSMTLHQEAIIQHFLIYKHKLNLKTWQLEKFPDNALELHKLLEPNMHKIDVSIA
jgi:hypothetical protein